MSGVVHVINVSGGKDSDCCYLLAVKRGRPFRAVFADTGNEHEWTYEHVRRLPERTGGPEVEVVRADFTDGIARRRIRLPEQWRAAGVPESLIDRAVSLLVPSGNPYLDLVLMKGMFAAGARRKFCTEYLKVLPVSEQVIRPLYEGGETIIQWLGIRADESAKRSDETVHPRFERRGRLAYYRPILSWTIDDVIAFHRRHNLPLNPLYAEGFSRVGCFPCVNERKAGVARIAKGFPEHIERIREWEALVSEVNVGWRKPERVGDICTFFPAGTVPGMDRNTIDDVVSWSFTKRGGHQFDMFAGMTDTGFIACTAGMGWCEAA